MQPVHHIDIQGQPQWDQGGQQQPGVWQAPRPEEDPIPKPTEQKGVMFWTLMELFTIACAIASIASSSTGYMTITKAKQSMDDVTDNWVLAPYTNVQIVAASASCSNGYSQDGTVMKWPGVTGGCGCPSSASGGVVSSRGACQSNQTAAGCSSSSSRSAVSLSSWKGSKLCFSKQGSDPAASLKGSGTLRPMPEAGKDCPSSFHICGSGTYDSAMATCAPNSETDLAWPTSSSTTGCPLTFVTSTNSLSVAGAASATFSVQQQVGLFTGNGFDASFANQMVYRAAGSDVVAMSLPIVALSPAFVQNDPSGLCYKGNDQSAYAGTTSLWSTSNSYPDKCDQTDPRWKQLDTISESNLLWENFAQHTDCAALGLTAAQLKDTTAGGSSPDYFASGKKCGTTFTAISGTSTTTFPCQNSAGDASKACGASDFVCQDTFYQSKCGSLIHYATSSYAKQTVGIFYQNEIYWKSKCPYTRMQVHGSNKILASATSAQQWLLGITILVNLILLGFAVYMLAQEYCYKQSIESIKAQESRVTGRVQLVARISAIPPAIAAIYFASNISNFYTSLAKQGCSDVTTNKAFTELATLLPTVVQSDSSTLAFNILQLVVVPAVLMIYHYICKKKPTQLASIQMEG